MTLDDLKKRATASELTLIEAVEKSLRDETEPLVKRKVLEFIRTNRVPSMDDARFNNDVYPQWLSRLEKHLNPGTP